MRTKNNADVANESLIPSCDGHSFAALLVHGTDQLSHKSESQKRWLELFQVEINLDVVIDKYL